MHAERSVAYMETCNMVGQACAAGMMFSEARLENIGPIRRAAIGDHRLSVFVGPNCSGKSIAARLLHAARRLGPPPAGAGAAALADAVLRGAGMERSDAVTHLMPSGRIELVEGGGKGGGGAVLDFGRGEPRGRMRYVPPPPEPAPNGAGERSVYVPAGRAAIIQSLFTLMRVRGDLLDSVLDALAGDRDAGKGERADAAQQRGADPGMPEHLEQFYRIALDAFSGELDGRAKGAFSRVFPGSIGMPAAPCHPPIAYADPLGFEAGIGPASSGAASALLVMAALHRIEPAGTLVVECPEEDLEPMRQIRLVGEIARDAMGRGIRLVLATHSPFVSHAALGLAGSGEMDPDDLGVYYFRRRRGSYTDVERVRVDREGEAELEMFDEAIDALSYGSAVPDAP